MSTSLISRGPSEFTDTTMGKLQLDPLVVDGMLARIDFLNSYSNPNADGAIANGATFKNLVIGGADMTYSQGASGALTNAAGKLGIVSPADPLTASGIEFPAGEFDHHTETGDRAFVWHVWHKGLAGYLSSGAAILGDRYAETSPYWGATPGLVIADGAAGAGAQPQAFVRASGGLNVPVPLPANEAYLNQAILQSFGVVNSTIYSFINGVQLGTVAYSNAAVGLPSRRSHGTVALASLPAAGDTITINGNLITFVASGAAGAQVNIGADANSTLNNLQTYINANKGTIGAYCDGTSASTRVIIQRAASTLLTLAKVGANITSGAPVASKKLRLSNHLKGAYYCLSVEDLIVSGRTIAAAVAAEYAGYRPKLVAAGLAA